MEGKRRSYPKAQNGQCVGTRWLRGTAVSKIGQGVRVNHFYVLAVVVSLLFLVVGIWFVYRTASVSRDETVGYIQNAIGQTTFAIDQHIQEEFDTLMTAASVAQDRELLAGDPVLRAVINGLHTHHGYLQIGFASASGQAFWVDEKGREHRGDVTGEGFAQRALAGENAVSRVRYDPVSDANIHFYSVPVYDGKTDAVEGVIFAAEPQDVLREIVNNTLYAGKGMAHIIDGQGNYVVKSHSPLVVGTGDNIFVMHTPISDALKQEILGNLQTGTASHLVKSLYGENRLIAYAPLEVNDWFVFYAVPEDMVSAGLKNVTVGTGAIVSAATAGFILFLFLLRKVNDKNRKALETLAFVDPVTGHRNMNSFLLDACEILEKTDRSRYAICHCHIKNFRYINDVFGRDVGDRMLRYLADFQERINQTDEVTARIGEDAFVAIRKYKSKREIEQRFEGTAQQLAIFPETFSRGYKAELVGGAYLMDPKDGPLTINDMLDRALVAQEEARTDGSPKRLGIYSREMREQKLWEAHVEATMEAALENSEFQIYLQPKIDIQHGDQVMGAEALVRWVSPELDVIPPGRFIPLFEKNGFIVDLDRFVMDTTCRYYKEAMGRGGMGDCVLSVNVSRLGLLRPDFVRVYTDIRNSYDIPAGHIELEFTESVVFGDNRLFQSVVAECQRNGFLCSMDDFGAGYSSLNMLKSIHVDVIKLDGQFFQFGNEVQRGQELVRNIIAMAKALDMKTVAEGIDDQDQLGKLRPMGCDAVQGYVFAKPMPLADFAPFVESWKAK